MSAEADINAALMLVFQQQLLLKQQPYVHPGTIKLAGVMLGI